MTYYLFQIIQHKTIRYPAANMPVSQISLHRLKLVRRKVLVLDLDETLIHSHHDGKKMLVLASLLFDQQLKFGVLFLIINFLFSTIFKVCCARLWNLEHLQTSSLK